MPPTKAPVVGGTLEPTSAPLPPALVSATFTDGGSEIYCEFEAATDRAQMAVDAFTCTDLFVSDALTDEGCSWSSDTTVRIVSTSSSTIAPFDALSVVPGMIRAKCLGPDATAKVTLTQALTLTSSP